MAADVKTAAASTERAPITMVQAINEAMAVALERDPRVLLFGQDVGVMGGVFRASDSLQERFGEERAVHDTLACIEAVAAEVIASHGSGGEVQ